MTLKSILRFIIGFIIAVLILSVAVPYVGIPKAQLYPPPYVYKNATGKATGYVTKVYKVPSADPMGTAEGVQDYLVDYQFRAPAWVGLGAPKGQGKNTLYKATVGVKQEISSQTKVGAAVPIKYEKTYPPINGINLPGYGRSFTDGSGIYSGWILWFLGALVLGFLIAPLLQRIFLREDY